MVWRATEEKMKMWGMYWTLVMLFQQSDYSSLHGKMSTWPAGRSQCRERFQNEKLLWILCGACALCVENLSMPMKIILVLQLHPIRQRGGGPHGDWDWRGCLADFTQLNIQEDVSQNSIRLNSLVITEQHGRLVRHSAHFIFNTFRNNNWFSLGHDECPCQSLSISGFCSSIFQRQNILLWLS